MRILILGDTGLLGSTLRIFLQSKKLNIFSINRKKNKNNSFQLKNFKNFPKLKKKIQQIKPSFIINCIGVTHYHKSYSSKKDTKIINSDLPIFLSKLCLKQKIYFIHISTDCVYSGQKGNYKEDVKKDPTSFYGITKSKGEVKNSYTTTLRTSFVGPFKKKSNQLFNWFFKQKNQIKGYEKVFFSGLTTLELSKIIHIYFIKKQRFYNNIFNVGGPKISKYNLLILFKRVFMKKVNIVKDNVIKLDRSLNSSLFIKRTKYKQKPWLLMLNDLKKFMILNNFKF